MDCASVALPWEVNKRQQKNVGVGGGGAFGPPASASGDSPSSSTAQNGNNYNSMALKWIECLAFDRKLGPMS
jgi:hypothetical protein